MPSDFETVFLRLREILKKNTGTLEVSQDMPEIYCLQCGQHQATKKPMLLAWVQIGKAYVSYHLMPVYGCPELLEGVSKELKARMQGKSCFNFKKVDEKLFAELEELTTAGFVAFRKAGYMG